jgi:hypothetical protein
MGTFLANWHDENKSRNIQFSVSFANDNGDVHIKEIVPNQVTIVCPETNTSLKTMTVYTAKGREILASQIRKSHRMVELKKEISDRRATVSSI